MFVEADQLVYDKDKNTVSAVGNARIYYQGRTIEADKVIYDRNSGRVYATIGHAKMTATKTATSSMALTSLATFDEGLQRKASS